MKVMIIGKTTDASQNGRLVFYEAERQHKDVVFVDLKIGRTQILKRIAQSKPDWVFLPGSRSLPVDFMRRIRRHCKLLVWDVDALNSARVKIWKSVAPVADVIVSAQLDVVNKFKNSARHMVWVPQYFDSSYFVPVVDRLDFTRPVHDVTFIGTSIGDGNRTLWLHRLRKEKDFDFHVEGKNTGFTRTRPLGAAMANIYRQSKIVIDIKRSGIVYSDFTTSDRIYKAMGCGAFYLTFDIPKIELLFEPNKHLMLYNSYGDLVNLIRYFLKYEEEREEIAACGAEEVHTKHLLEHRIPTFWELMEEVT